MPWPFTSTRPKPSKKKKSTITPEQKANKAIDKGYLKAITEDEDMLRAAVAKKFGITVPTKQDAAEKIRGELRKKHMDDAVRLIEKDPEMLQRYQNQLAEEILGMPADGHSKSGLENLTEELEEFEQVAQRLGYNQNTGMMTLLGNVTKDLPALAAILQTFLKSSPPGSGVPQIAERRYVIMNEDGSASELGADEYMRLMQQRQLKAIETRKSLPAAQVTTLPKPAQTPPPPPAKAPPATDRPSSVIATHIPEPVREVKEEQVTELPSAPKAEPSPERGYVINAKPEEPKMPGGEHSLALKTWDLDREPEEWVDELLDQKYQNNQQAEFILTFFATATPEQVIQTLAPFAAIPEYKELVAKITANRDWLSRVIQYVKDMNQV